MSWSWDGVSAWLRHADLYPCPPAWRIDPITLVDSGFFYILRGQGWVEFAGRRLAARPGDLFLNQRGQQFCAGHDPGRPLTVYSSAFRLLGAGGMDAYPQVALPYRLTIPPEARRPLEERWQILVNDVHAGPHEPGGSLAARGSLLRLAAEVLRLAAALPPAARTGHASAPPGADTRAGRVIAYIDARLAERLSLARLAAVAEVSPVHFAKIFRRQTGMTPMSAVRQRRLERAKVLLATGDASIEEIARQVGFPDPFHFSRLFRRLLGQSPSSYRQAFVDPFRG
jgi:AraC-like DNA-binding protein